jgi:hypothetical protein
MMAMVLAMLLGLRSLTVPAADAAAAGSSSDSSGGASCASASHCGLLGACSAGRCACDAGFRGATCQLPDLGPAKPPAENALFSQTSHSWGGKPILNPDGKTWSLFAAEMTQHCPLQKFNNNSAVRRAVSQSAGGPFSGGEIVFPPFAHNPTVNGARRHHSPVLYRRARTPRVQLQQRAARRPPPGVRCAGTALEAADGCNQHGLVQVAERAVADPRRDPACQAHR